MVPSTWFALVVEPGSHLSVEVPSEFATDPPPLQHRLPPPSVRQSYFDFRRLIVNARNVLSSNRSSSTRAERDANVLRFGSRYKNTPKARESVKGRENAEGMPVEEEKVPRSKVARIPFPNPIILNSRLIRAIDSAFRYFYVLSLSLERRTPWRDRRSKPSVEHI